MAIVLFGWLLAGGAAAETWTATAEPEASAVRFEVGATLHTVRGSARLVAAEITFDSATGVASGGVEIDLESVDTGNARRDRNLHQRVLESERFPRLAFIAERVEGEPASAGAASLSLVGRMLIHGEEHGLAVPVALTVDADRFEAVAVFIVPFVEWGMEDPSRALLRVAKRVEVTVELAGRWAPAAGD